MNISIASIQTEDDVEHQYSTSSSKYEADRVYGDDFCQKIQPIQRSARKTQCTPSSSKLPTEIKPTSKRNRSRVSFDRFIEIREHPRILGDNPAAMCGPPLSIGWYDKNHHHTLQLPFDAYEIARSHERCASSRHDFTFYLPWYEREKILMEDVGVSVTEMIEVQIETDDIKASRNINNLLRKYDNVIAFIETFFDVLVALSNWHWSIYYGILSLIYYARTITKIIPQFHLFSKSITCHVNDITSTSADRN